MTGRRLACFAVVAAIMVITASPAAATKQDLRVADTHTTDSDFSESNGATLTNVSVDSSGTNASVSLDRIDFSDDFESDAADSGVPDNWVHSGGSYAKTNVTTVQALDTQSHYVSASGTTADFSPDKSFATRTDNYSVSIYELDGEEAKVNLTGLFGTYISVGMFGGDLKYVNNNGEQTISSVPDSREWVTVTIYDINASADEYSVKWSTPTDQGTATGLHMLNGMQNGYDDVVITTQQSGSGARAFYDDHQLGTDRDTGRYISQNYTAEQASQFNVNATINNGAIDVRGEYYDGATWQVANSATYTTTANHTLDVTGHGQETTWRLNATFRNQSGATTASIHDESLRWAVDAPAIDNSSASPPNHTDLSERDQDFTINVSDRDFGTLHGDSLTGELFLDGNSQGTDSLSSNGTLNVSATVSQGGFHEYYWEVSDSYGLTTTSQTFNISSPDELGIWNESENPTRIDKKTVDVTIYSENKSGEIIVNRSTSNGKLDMAGLPADKPLIISADAPGYRPRRIFVPSLYERQRIYLLNESVKYTDVVFGIEDYSGNYPQDATVMKVQRGINESWQTMVGDYFGATGQFPAKIAHNERHRLVLINVETGRQRVLGTYTPVSSTTESVKVSPRGKIDPIRSPATLSLNPSAHQLVALNNVGLDAKLSSGNQSLDSWRFSAYYINGSTNNTLYQTSGTDASGFDVQPSVDLSGKHNGTLKVVTAWDVGGVTQRRVTNYSIIRPRGQGKSLIESLGAIEGQVPAHNQDSFTTFVAILTTIVATGAIASQVPMPTETIGLVALGLLTGWAIVGWLGYDLVFVGVVSWGAIAYLRRGY